MSTKMNLWSLTLVPGEKIPIYIRHDFTITNAALGEELRSTDGRSVVKVTHHPLPPHFGDDSDSEIDSDVDIDDEDDSEEEFELDQEEGFKLTPKKGKKANGDVSMDDEEDEDNEEDIDAEEDSDDEDDEDFDDDEPVEETNVICALTAGRIEQASLNLTFIRGDAVMFEVTGENAVHLMGNYIYQGDESDDESDYDSEVDDYDMYGSDLEGEESEEDAPVGKISEIVEPVAPKKKAAAAVAAPATENKKRKAEAIDSPAAAAKTAAAGDVSVEGLSKAQQKKLAKKARLSEGSTAAPAAAEKKAEKVPEKKTEKVAEKKQKKLPSGLIIEDAKTGTGPVAKPGKRLSMRYVGKLENGKQFDANTGGTPFSFVLGRGEVIKGWDEGLNGMAVGGERKLTIPANLAYGSQKIPGIPKNSTLLFDVKLLAIK